jgi:hypothetical protein
MMPGQKLPESLVFLKSVAGNGKTICLGNWQAIVIRQRQEYV